MGPQSRPAEFNLASPRLARVPDPLGRASRSGRGGRVHFPWGERRDRFGGRQKGPGKVTPSPRARERYSPGIPSAGCRAEECLPRRGCTALSARSTGEDCFAVLSDCGWSGTGFSRANAKGLWRFSRHPIRPVLKHGPRSLTCARVMGLYET